MARKEKVYEYVELNDKTPVQKLSLGDQLRVLINRLTYDQSLELRQEDLLVSREMTLRADLYTFILRATDPIRAGLKKSVTFSVDSKFEPVFDSVIESDRFKDHYRIQVSRPVLEYDIPYLIKVTMEVRT